MVWTKAEGHTYAEALNVVIARGYSQADLDAFLAANPGDLYRVPESFEDRTSTTALSALGYNPIEIAAIPVGAGGPMTGASTGNTGIAGSASGGSQVLLDGEITRSSLPARQIADVVSSPGQYLPSADAQIYSPAAGGMMLGGSIAVGGVSIPWWLIIAAGIGIYFLARKS